MFGVFIRGCISESLRPKVSREFLFYLHLPMSNGGLFCMFYAWSTISTFNDRSTVKPLSMTGKSVRSTCLSPVLYDDLLSLLPEADIFFTFLLESWPPSWTFPGPPAEAPCYLLPRELCVQRIGIAWLVQQGSNLLLARSLSHIFTDSHKHKRSHDHPSGNKMFTAV